MPTTVLSLRTRRSCFFIGALLSVVFFFLFPLYVYGAILHVLQSNDYDPLARTFSVVVTVESLEEPINAVGGTLHFPEDKLSIVSLQKENSVFNLWAVDPVTNFSSSTIDFGGGTTDGGFVGVGEVCRIVFQVQESGFVGMELTEANVLAHDGFGTNVLRTVENLSYTIFEDAFSTPEESVTLTSMTIEELSIMLSRVAIK